MSTGKKDLNSLILLSFRMIYLSALLILHPTCGLWLFIIAAIELIITSVMGTVQGTTVLFFVCFDFRYVTLNVTAFCFITNYSFLLMTCSKFRNVHQWTCNKNQKTDICWYDSNRKYIWPSQQNNKFSHWGNKSVLV